MKNHAALYDKELPPMERLRLLMRALRDPEHGCPWDVAQDARSIAPYMIEEAYEAVDAIERGDIPALKSELGDVLLQVVFHSQMAEEAGAFSFDEVAEAITNKMIARHPHVFGDEDARSAEEQSRAWEAQKAKEREAVGQHSVLDDVPAHLPALIRAQKLLKRAESTGFRWPNQQMMLAKIEEEYAELQRALKSEAQERQEAEWGDMVLAMIALARAAGFDADQALRRASMRFEARFRQMEQAADEASQPLAERSLEEHLRHWQAAKQVVMEGAHDER